MYKEICSKGAKNRHNYLLLCNGDVDFKVSITFIYPTPPKKNEVQKKKDRIVSHPTESSEILIKHYQYNFFHACISRPQKYLRNVDFPN